MDEATSPSSFPHDELVASSIAAILSFQSIIEPKVIP